jgi:hypothetical protein
MAGSNRGKSPKRSLEQEVQDALLTILRDKQAPATARAHAARSLVIMLGEEQTPGEQRAASGMTIDELDAEIASIEQQKR